MSSNHTEVSAQCCSGKNRWRVHELYYQISYVCLAKRLNGDNGSHRQHKKPWSMRELAIAEAAEED
jgi:hypothetical protein